MTTEKKKPSETEAERLKREADEELTRELEDTFPASDPPKVTRGPYERQHTSPSDGSKETD
ncbi:hypothetical protein [Aquamicrobium sp. LC103]|uniref:hypothetical protein n=1 Tax=Aquamicrobium sp. LC103 TaxID=1120658 RepID=UPI00063EC0DF|nr:hypothetical protein [Aquamicrobium sp. LC103]TKT77430.1 hypothetical protein XW59_013225 [Aquamicrobium sp. LC103]